MIEPPLVLQYWMKLTNVYGVVIFAPILIACAIFTVVNLFIKHPPMIYRCTVLAVVLIGFFNLAMTLWVLYFYRSDLKDIPALDYLWSLGILLAPIAAAISLRFARGRNYTSGLEQP